MYFAQELDSSGLIAYSNTMEKVNANAVAVISSIGFLLSNLILVSLLYNGTTNRPIYMYIISMCTSGSVVAGLTAGISWYNVSLGGFGVGTLWCEIYGMVSLGHLISFYLSLFCGLGELYRGIVCQKSTSLIVTKFIILMVWLVATVASLWPFYVPQQERMYQISLLSSKIACLPSWPIANSDHPAVLGLLISTATLIVLTVSMMMATFTAICQMYFKSTRKAVLSALTSTSINLESSTSSKPTSVFSSSSEMTPNQRKLLLLSISVSLSFLFLTFPFQTNIMVQAITQSSTSSIVDGTTFALFCTFYLMIGIWVVVFENGVKSAVEILFSSIFDWFSILYEGLGMKREPNSNSTTRRRSRSVVIVATDGTVINNPSAREWRWTMFVRNNAMGEGRQSQQQSSLPSVASLSRYWAVSAAEAESNSFAPSSPII